MKKILLTLAVVVPLLGCGDRSKDSGADQRNEDGWSETVNGLRGRLVRYAPPQVNKTEIIGISVELKNTSGKPLAVQNDPASVHVRLSGPDGSVLDPSLPFARSGPVALPEWGVLPPDAYLGFSLYDHGVGVPEGQGALLALLPPSRVWMLKPGKYTLRGKFTVKLNTVHVSRTMASMNFFCKGGTGR